MGNSESTNFTDYYKLLEISPRASLPEIRQAFLLKAKTAHPDAGGEDREMQQLNLAYKTLMQSSSKAAYDRLHNFHTGVTPLADYKYDDSHMAGNTDEMSDAAIDSFLDSVFEEYRNGPPKPPKTMKQRLKKLLEF